MVTEATAPRWLLLATRQLTARPGYAVVQVSSLAVGLLALVLLVLLRTDLVDSVAQGHPARCAQPLCHQHPARPERSVPGAPGARRRGGAV
jgi:predicted lysophospholipase L1 biosynthesis ABC-type transport system permease subunit